MPNPRTFQIQEISAHPGPVPGAGARREAEVCKYIDVTTCIGCKACEVACVEWNDHPFRETTFNDTYQTMPTTEWNYYNLIKFVEDQRDDGNLGLRPSSSTGSRLVQGCPNPKSRRRLHLNLIWWRQRERSSPKKE